STGGCGFCAGLGQAIIGPNLTYSPEYSGLLLVQIARMASMRSRITLLRFLTPVPWLAISSAFQPAPTPKMNRPFEIWSTEATDLAVWIGSRCGTRQTTVAIFRGVVTAATAPSTTNGSITS